MGARSRRWRRLLWAPALLWGALLFRAWALSPPAPPPGGGPLAALHVHTSASDGRASIAEVAKVARATGLSVLLLGDHNLAPPPARVMDGVLVVPGVELSTSYGHVLAYGGEGAAGPRLRHDDPLGAARASGPFVVLSHPINRRRPWTGPFRGADAMEVVSADSAFREATARPWRLLTALLVYPASPELAVLHLSGLDRPARARFHEALAAGELAQGLCGHDAHGLPAYAPAFRVLRTHLDEGSLLPAPERDPEAAARSVIAALRSGHFYCALDGLADASSFFLEVGKKTVRAGLRRPLPEGLEARVLLYRDGGEVARTTIGGGSTGGVSTAVGAGRWHAEVELSRPWLFGHRRFFWILSGVRAVTNEAMEAQTGSDP